MTRLADRVFSMVQSHPGVTDRELADVLLGKAKHPAHVNQICRLLMSTDLIRRTNRPDGRIGNYPIASAVPGQPLKTEERQNLGEDSVNDLLAAWLISQRWDLQSRARGHSRGVDIVAQSEGRLWSIQVKGEGKHRNAQQNNFIDALGQTLYAMDDSDKKYSIAFPDLPAYRRLWSRVPECARGRTGITALFVGASGQVEEVL